jgi:hypothetical protein
MQQATEKLDALVIEKGRSLSTCFLVHSLSVSVPPRWLSVVSSAYLYPLLTPFAGTGKSKTRGRAGRCAPHDDTSRQRDHFQRRGLQALLRLRRSSRRRMRVAEVMGEEVEEYGCLQLTRSTATSNFV